KAAGDEASHLPAAEAEMNKAVAQLGEKQQLADALPSERTALEHLQKEAARLDEALGKANKTLDPANFAGMKQDQAGNRQATGRISELVRKLGENGARALTELIRADGSMTAAEGNLGQMAADPASGDQQQALASLKLARDELQREADALLAALGP